MNAPSAARPVLIGEALFDVFPDGSETLGGAPFNVAWHLQGFGCRPLFVTRVGDDDRGRLIVEKMRAWGMDTAGVQVDPARPTGEVRVTLANGQPSFQILPDRAWDHLEWAPIGQLLNEAHGALLYHGSLIARSPASREAVERLVAESGGLPFVDLNLRPPYWDDDYVHRAVARARWIKVNDDELRRLARGGGSLEVAARRLRASAKARWIAVTQGEEGAFLLDSQGRVHTERPPRVENFVDAVGAGDAFSAVLIVGALRGWPPDESLKRAVQFAACACGQRGAIGEDAAFYELPS
jgi:fructokinase